MRAVIFVMGNRKLKSARWDELDDLESCPLMSDEQIRAVQKWDLRSEHIPWITSHSRACQKKIWFIRLPESKEAIENVLEKPIQTFSYPYGRVDERVKKIVSDSGFLFACGVYSGSAKFSQSMMDFRRLAINQDTSRLKFLVTLLLPYQYIEWLYFRLKKRMVHDIKMETHSNIKTGSKNGTSKSENFDMQNMFNSKFL
jgi:hypothetical protein